MTFFAGGTHYWTHLYWYKLKDIQRQICCKQWRQVKFKNTLTKWTEQKQTFRTARNTQNSRTTRRNRHSENSFIVFFLSSFSPFYWYFIFIKMFSLRTVDLLSWRVHWLASVLTSHLLNIHLRRKRKYVFTFLPRPLKILTKW